VKGEEKQIGNLNVKGKADNGSVVLTAIEIDSKPLNTPADKSAIDKYWIFAGVVNSNLTLKFPIPISSNKGQKIQSQSSFDVLSFNEQSQQWEVLPSVIKVLREFTW
jgi:hypothetical protein